MQIKSDKTRAGEPEQGVFGFLEPEHLERKKQEPEPEPEPIRSRNR